MIHALKILPEFFKAMAAGTPCAIGEIRESRRMLQGRSEEVPVYDRK